MRCKSGAARTSDVVTVTHHVDRHDALKSVDPLEIQFGQSAAVDYNGYTPYPVNNSAPPYPAAAEAAPPYPYHVKSEYSSPPPAYDA